LVPIKIYEFLIERGDAFKLLSKNTSKDIASLSIVFISPASVSDFGPKNFLLTKKEVAYA
jgi:hypothetical protein